MQGKFVLGRGQGAVDGAYACGCTRAVMCTHQYSCLSRSVPPSACVFLYPPLGLILSLLSLNPALGISAGMAGQEAHGIFLCVLLRG